MDKRTKQRRRSHRERKAKARVAHTAVGRRWNAPRGLRDLYRG